ncbi:MAG TPA: enoyl-CoA hydratase-related protein [Myxococcota bacterium]
MTEAVRVEREGVVARITLDRPPANAIDVNVSRALYAAVKEFEDDPELRVAIVTGGGERFFSAGWDLKAASAGGGAPEDHGPGGFAGITEYFGRRKPLIAAINGMAVGGGFELALACDLIVAAERAEFFLPEVRIGIIPDAGGVLHLPRRVPRALASRLLLTGDRLPAREAARIGLINEVVPDAQLMDAAGALARRIAEAAPLAVKALKAVLEATQTLGIEEGYALMRSGKIEEYSKMLASEDAREGPRAFAEKREPQWRGR